VTAVPAKPKQGQKLVIVESPAKARTISRYLGPEFVVESSIGHIRDLPERASQIPKEEREKYGALGVAIDDDFEPYYVVQPDKKGVVDALKKSIKKADELLLATDEDREGEAIAWHLLQELRPKIPVRRMVFHEITRDAIRAALEHTREVDERLVDSQETRRILDRLYGYEVSPVLWKKVMPRLSAGRVQSVATRLVVERERRRMAFVSASYWDAVGTFLPGSFEARLVALDGRRLAQGRDFTSDGSLREEVARLDELQARGLVERLDGATFSVRTVDEKPYSRKPSAPFMTSTLQQEASRKLGYTAQTTMRVAQRLYEQGHITYMRTDSTTLSEVALTAARNQARELYGADHVPEAPRRYDRKVKNAQEAHEAIRPSGDTFRVPASVAGELDRDERALYELIWMRTLASQMADARGQTVSVRISARSRSDEDVEFGVSGTTITFPGFLAAYEEGRDDEASRDEDNRLPALSPGDVVEVERLEAQGHETTPPARYTEATLVKALEDRGIGRPSTYASIISTILDRGYVFKKGTALVPTFVAFAVTRLLEEHYGRLVDYDFTARMEDDLDRIAAGEEERVTWLTRFYRGASQEPGLHTLVTEQLDEIDARAVNSIPLPFSDVVVRVGRYGPYLERDGQRATLPTDIAPDELTAERAEELLAKGGEERGLGLDPTTGNPIMVRSGRYGPYVTEQLPEESNEKPRTASLFASMSVETVSLEEALRLLSLPRVVGVDPGDGQEIVAMNGRYGPFIKKGTETRSLDSEEQLFMITSEEALRILAQPRTRRGSSQAPLRELGQDPTDGRAVVVKDGRFGPYVTDGETNASIRGGDSVESLTLERALELLAERRAKGPAKPRRRRART
jgi:DNA topoisomerase-1